MAVLAPLGAFLITAAAAWLSVGTLGFAGAGGARIAVLPVSAAVMLSAAAVGGIVVLLRRAGASMRPLALLVLLALPWLPLPVPAAFLLWVRPFSLLIWVAVVLSMVASLPKRSSWPAEIAMRPRIAAGVLAAAICAFSAWRVAPMIPGGDEPHYLIITQSLLIDHALTIDDVHRRGDYRAYYPTELQPHVQMRGKNGRIYSVHAPGLPALVAPAFVLGGYHAVLGLLILIAACGSALAWHVGWLATRRTDAAWFGWAAVTLPVTAIFQSFTIYPDGIGGVLTLTGMWALLRADDESKSGETRLRPWLLHGAALALLPWLHSRFAVLAGGLGALVLLRLSSTKNPAAKAVAFLGIPAISAILWVGYFVAIYGRPDPSAAYGAGEIGSFSFVPGGLAGLLFDQRFGLVTYAPVLLVAFIGLGTMLARRETRRLGLELLFVVVPYLLTVTHFAMWWAGWSPPARFFAPVLPLFAVPAAAAWTFARHRAARVLAIVSVVLTICASTVVVAVDRGRLAFNTRDAPSLWFEWMGRLADLTAATPMWARDTDAPLFRAIAIWLLAAAAGWLLLRTLDRQGRLRPNVNFHLVAAATLAGVVMLASSMMWAFQGTSGRTASPSQLQLLETVASQDRGLAFQLNPLSRLTLPEVPARLRIELSRAPGRRPAAREVAPLFALPSLPAGEYRLTPVSDDPRGWLMVGITRDPRDPFALKTVQLPMSPITLRFPVSLRSLVVRGDEDAWRTVRGLIIEPVVVEPRGSRLTADLARRAVRYGTVTTYFLDDRSFPEPQAFWIGGARDGTVVLQPDAPGATQTLLLRNAPVDNRIVLQAGGWTRVLQMAPGEEQRVQVPIEAAHGASLLRIEAGSGFRPSEREPASRDQRFLGVWVKVEE
jgi:hypothetical protein